MKLHKALKLRKSLGGDIAKIKKQIQEKNSYLVGQKVGYYVPTLKEELMVKINKLMGLKYAINEANREIQAKIYTLGEYKALIAFWMSVPVIEGSQVIGYGDVVKDYEVQLNETDRDVMIAEYQVKVDALQEEIDIYNYTTDIPWEEPEPDNREIPSVASKDREKLQEEK